MRDEGKRYYQASRNSEIYNQTMADQVGHQEMESGSNESQERYRLDLYPGSQIPSDFRNLIIAPFLNSLRYGNDLFKLIDKDAYYFSYGRYIELLLQRPSTQVKFAILDDETVLGWCLTEGKILHYVWVKKEVRRQGIARALMPKSFDTISHITNKGIHIWVNHYPGAKFDPFI